MFEITEQWRWLKAENLFSELAFSQGFYMKTLWYTELLVHVDGTQVTEIYLEPCLH